MKKFMISMLLLISGANMFGAGPYAQNLWRQGARCFTNLRQQVPHAWSRVRQSPYARPVAMGAGLGGLAYYSTRSASADEGQEQSTAPSLQNRFANWANRLSAQIEPALRRNLPYAYGEFSFGDSVTSADLYGQELQKAKQAEITLYQRLREHEDLQNNLNDPKNIMILTQAETDWREAMQNRLNLELASMPPSKRGALIANQKKLNPWISQLKESLKDKQLAINEKRADTEQSAIDNELANDELKDYKLLIMLNEAESNGAPEYITDDIKARRHILSLRLIPLLMSQQK